MSRRGRAPLSILLLFALALLPQRADVGPSRAWTCTSESVCPPSAGSLRPAGADPVLAGHATRLASDAVRPPDAGPRHAWGSPGAVTDIQGRARNGRAQAIASTREYFGNLPDLREAASGRRASPPRAPPLHV